MHTVKIPGFDLPLTAQSGQCFRFLKDGEGWRLIAEGLVLRIVQSGPDLFLADCSAAEWETHWQDYFDLQRDYGALMARISRDDRFLQEAVRQAGGLRILRQEPWETLVGFIISQRKNLPAIQGCMEMLARRFGSRIGEDACAFPTPGQLAAQPLEALQACGLGYRSPYILHTARMVARGEVDLNALCALDDEALLAALCRFPGVGHKVASCVSLFAYQRMDAFPRDVWILRVEAEHYGGRFPQENYPGFAGILQQLMFCYRRSKAYADHFGHSSA